MLTDADGATIVIRDGDECCYLDEDAIVPLWKGKRFPMQDCISGWAMLHGQIAVVPDIYADSRIPAEAYGSTLVKSLAMVPIRSLDPIGAIGIYWARHHEATEEELHLLQGLADATAVAMENVSIHSELEQQVRERTRELEAARVSAQRALEIADRANRAKSRLVAAASHDLRQPLQSLALLNGSLRRIVAHRTLESALPAIQDILWQQEQAIQAASRLVNALLDISKLESGAVKPEITDFPLAGLLDELHQEFASAAGSKGLAFEVDSYSGRVRSDPVLLERILRNVLANAIKYTREGKVLLRCQPQAATVRLQVVDTGVGIPADQLPHIFDEFYQVEATPTATSREGYGLGLSIVDRLVKLLDLKLDVRSEPGKGSIFSLELPASPAAMIDICQDRRSADVRPASSQNAVRRILLMEDDKGVRDATCLLLRAEGFEVSSAASPAEARERADAEGEPDLLITDYHLGCPETGLDVIAALRTRFGDDLKAILISGDTSPAIKGLTLDENTRVTSKPVQPEQLLRLVADLIELKRATER